MYKFWKSKAFEPLDEKKIEFDNVKEEPQPRNWQIVARTYAAPVNQIPENLQDIALVEKLMFGVTTLLLQDTLTGDIKKEEIIGSDENQLFNILENAGQFGMQYINYNGKRFAIAPVPVEENLSVV
jgi:hypothetical protein